VIRTGVLLALYVTTLCSSITLGYSPVKAEENLRGTPGWQDSSVGDPEGGETAGQEG